MTLAIGPLFSWEIIALTVLGVILFAVMLDLAFSRIWRDADRPTGWIEDASSNQERER